MIGLMLVLVGGASGATLDVPGTYATVQEAINAASAGDTILVGPGTVRGAVLVNKSVSIVGTGMNQSILASDTGDYVVEVVGAELALSSVTVDGEGVRGGINVLSSPSVLVEDVKVRGGTLSDPTWWGAGLRVQAAEATVRSSILCLNSAEEPSGDLSAGAVNVLLGASLLLEQSVLMGNTADGAAGAVLVRGEVELVNNVFVGNSATLGAAVSVENTGTLDFRNNIVVQQSPHPLAADTVFAVALGSGTATGGSNLFFSNVDADIDRSLAADTFGEDPLLRNATVSCDNAGLGDFALSPGSPAIDAGDPVGVFDDIGAVEFVDADGDGFAAGFDDCNDDAADIHDGAVEVAGDGVDQDCDGSEHCFVDADGDGDRSEVVVYGASVDCGAPNEALVSQPVDCDDDNPLQNSGFPELPCDGIDNDCNPATLDDDGSCDTGGTGDTGPSPADTDTDADSDVDADTDTDVGPVDTGSIAPRGVAIDGCGCQTVAVGGWSTPWSRRR